MHSLIFATNNKNKAEEIRAVLNDQFSIITLKEAGIDIDIPEPHERLEENATEKSRTIFNMTGKDCFSEDTGLEVFALNGKPGVHSARYAGNNGNAQNNISKLLKNLEDIQDRKARFRTVISLMINGKEQQFEGICPGQITFVEKGANGFGYDAIFIPDGSTKTFAEMTMEEKNRFSHRKKATNLLVKYLNTPDGKN